MDFTDDINAAEKHPKLRPLLGDLKDRSTRHRIHAKGLYGELPVRSVIYTVDVQDEDTALLGIVDKRTKFDICETGVLYDAKNQVKVATNRFVLAIFPAPGIDTTSIQHAQGPADPRRYPDYKSIIPEKPKYVIEEIYLKTLCDKVRGVRAATKHVDVDIKAAIGGPVLYTYIPDVLDLALITLRNTGTEYIDFEVTEFDEALIVRDSYDTRKLVAVMPCVQKYGDALKPYTAESTLFTYIVPYDFK